LAKLPAGRHHLPPEFVRDNQRNRILAAALEVFGTRGFVASSVQDLIREAHVSRGTLYEHFMGKEECLLALLDLAAGFLRAEAAAAAAEEEEWAIKLCLSTERIVAILAEDQRLARVCAVEVWIAGDQVRARRESLMTEVVEAMRAGRTESSWGSQLPELLETLLFTGVVSVLGLHVLRATGRDPGTVAAELAEILLAPYLGQADARELVRSTLPVSASEPPPTPDGGR
jgi:AcrR family transcriptional regulator